MTPEGGAELILHDSPDEVAAAVAGHLVARLAERQRAGQLPSVVLTGGSIADRTHRAVLSVPGCADVDWSRVEVWFGDERYVPAGDRDRNARQAREALLDHVPVRWDRVHEMPASDAGHKDLDAAAAAYDEKVRERAPALFDVVMLGIGPDGHVASLFPGAATLDVDDAVAVAEADSPKPPPQRISLTFPALNRAREVWFLVAGEEKAHAVARALGGADPHETPAAAVHGQERTVWFLDRAAAGQLPRA